MHLQRVGRPKPKVGNSFKIHRSYDHLLRQPNKENGVSSCFLIRFGFEIEI